MTELEGATELFDLFGETGYCTICQDDLAEGERVRAIRACQHLFHSACLDPWLVSKGDCPLCRVRVRPAAASPEVIQDASQTIRGLYSTMQQTGTPPAANSVLSRILTQLETLLTQTTPVAPPAPATTDRMLLAYCIAHGIIKRYRTAALFDAHKQTIRGLLGSFTLEGLRPLPIECDTFAALCRSRLTYKHELMRRLELGESAVLNAPQILEIRQRLAAAQEPLVRDHWRA